jgi:ADP-ribosyl-[dinitrogen reductase] hydrolase
VGKLAGGSFRGRSQAQVKGDGYVLDTLEAALWAWHTFSTFEQGLVEVINLGEDTDTTGAVYGQLAGAWYGLSGIPERWHGKVWRRGEIIALADALFLGNKDVREAREAARA